MRVVNAVVVEVDLDKLVVVEDVKTGVGTGQVSAVVNVITPVRVTLFVNITVVVAKLVVVEIVTAGAGLDQLSAITDVTVPRRVENAVFVTVAVDRIVVDDIIATGVGAAVEVTTIVCVTKADAVGMIEKTYQFCEVLAALNPRIHHWVVEL